VLEPPGLRVATADGVLHLEAIQPAGKRPMAAADWMRGQRGIVGIRLGT
jgi:methionyl-tRNA formyltransferase